MGIQILTGQFDDPEVERRLALQKRIRALAVVLILTLAARVVFKNPAPPKRPDHRAFKALPGVLKNLSAQDRAKLTPTQVAMLQEADQKSARPQSTSDAASLLAQNANPTEQGTYKFVYKTKESERWKPAEVVDASKKKSVVVFRGGGFLLAEKAEKSNRVVDIRMNKGLQASVPSSSVRQIIEDASGWKAPLPPGKVELKPARGITIIVATRTAKRITVTKSEEKAG